MGDPITLSGARVPRRWGLRAHAAFAVAALALLAHHAEAACTVPPQDIRADRVGDDVRLTWTGTLDPGDSWVVYRGDIDQLWGSGANDVPVGAILTGGFTEAGLAADLRRYYWRVRCEGPGGNGPWSEMAFKMVRLFATVPDFQNVYHVSTPYWLGLPDVADTADPNPCAPVAGVGDGVVNADDLLCAWWTSGRGNLMVSRRNEETCRFEHRAILYEEFDLEGAPGVVLAGEWTAPLVPGEAYLVTTCDSATTSSLDNLAVLVGAHDSVLAACLTVELPASGCVPVRPLLNVPYHATYRYADEILCGVANVDWFDTDGDGNPDTCPNGIFLDDATGPQVTARTFDNVPDFAGADNDYVARVVRLGFEGRLAFFGPPYALAAGEACEAWLTSGHLTPTQFCPPVER